MLRPRISRIAAVATLGAIALLATWLQQRDVEQKAVPSSNEPKESVAAPVDISQAVPPPYKPILADYVPPPPPSLRGSTPDGEVLTDEHGNLRVTHGLKALFDYYLTAAGEEPEGTVVARIDAAIGAAVEEPAAAQARALLRRYMTWRQRGAQVLAETGKMNPMAGLAAMRAVRRTFFSEAEVQAFWGEEEAAAAAALQDSAAQADPSLSARDREAALQAAAALGDSVSVQADAAVHADDAAKQLRASGASDDAVHAARVRQFGAAATGRLEALDVARQKWQTRVDAYLQARAQIAQDTSLDDDARRRATDALLQENFSSTEAMRVRVLEAQQP